MRIVIALLATTVLALAGAEAALWITDVDLSITALMGMTMVVGIVTEAGIFLAYEFQSLVRITDPVERLIQAGINRWRPIVMTTLAAILALAPLAMGLGEGADMQRPLAIAVIGGLVLQAPLVLVVLPLILAAMRPGRLGRPGHHPPA
jgi:multidrug efflux pump subunit AcrB